MLLLNRTCRVALARGCGSIPCVTPCSGASVVPRLALERRATVGWLSRINYTTASNDAPLSPEEKRELTKQAFEHFSWLRPRDKKRLTEIPYPSRNSWLLSFKIVRNTFCAIIRASVKAELQRNTTDQYFPREFLGGATGAFSVLCELLSKQNTFRLRRVMTPMLYDVFSDDIENLEKNGLRIDFRPIKVHNARIKDVWVDYGPHEAFDTYLSLQERLVDYYYNIVYCIRLAVPKGPGATETPDRGGRTGMAADLEGDATSVTGSLRRGMGSMVRGVQYKVDVEFDADMAYAVFKDDEHIHYEEGEQTIVLRFSTPHYSPSPNLAQAYLKKENEVMPGLRPGYVVPDEDIDPPFEWRVSDIDYLLFQNECREIQSIIEQNRGKRS